MRWLALSCIGAALVAFFAPRASAEPFKWALRIEVQGKSEARWLYQERTACEIDAVNERMLDRSPPGSRISCAKVSAIAEVRK